MPRRRVALVVSGAVLLAAFVLLATTADLHRRIPLLLALYGSAFAAYVVAVRIALRERGDRFFLVFMLAVALVSRVILVPARPDLSTDIYRYAWEGRVVLEGVNPFAVAPEDSSLVPLRDRDYGRIGHPHMATIYPPLAQGVFALAAWIHPGVTALKALFVLFDLAALGLLLFLLRSRGRPPTHALIYAWSPLVILETGHSGHMDVIGVFFLVLGLVLLERRRVTGFAALGASFLAKFLPVALLPFLAARRRWSGIGVFVLVAVAGYLPFADAGIRLADSLRTYGGSWSFNGLPFQVLTEWLGSGASSRGVLVGGGAAFVVAAAFRERDIARYTFLVVACWLLLAPTVYPWYLTWMVALLCLYPSRAWIAFTGLVFLSYWVWVVFDAGGGWVLPAGVLAIEYVPFYTLLAWEGIRRSRAHG